MRAVSATALAKAQAVEGVEATVVLEVQLETGTLRFGDRELGGVEERITGLNAINLQVNEGGASVGSVSVTLDDSDLYLQGLLGSRRFEGCVCRVLQVFDGDVADAVELMVGRVGSPVVWVEKDRTFSFDIVAYHLTTDEQVPFAPDEASGLQEAAWNRPWPRIYGTPIDVPATQVTFPPAGVLIRELQPLHTYVDVEVRPNVAFPTTECTVQIGNEYLVGTFVVLTTDPVTTLRFHIRERNASKGIVYSKDRAVLSQIEVIPDGFLGKSWEDDPRYAAWDAGDVLLAGNWLFLLDTSDQLSAGRWDSTFLTGGTLYGSVTLPSFAGNKNYILYQKGDATRGQLPWLVPSGLYYISIGAKADVRGVLNVNETLWPAGTQVELVEEVTYVASDLPADAVLQVRAWREVKVDERGGKKRELVVLPEDFYVVDLNALVAGRRCATVTLSRSLSSRGAGWDGDLYVTVRRGDGNIVDILAELLPSVTISSGTVHDDVAPYPMDFAILDRRDALALAFEICWQGRCGLSIIGSTATLTYLSREPTSFAFSYNNDATLEGELQLTSSETGEVYNDAWYRWRRRYSEEPLEKVHYLNQASIDAFGRRRADVEIWAYRHKALVQKTAEFWFNRRSRVWRKLRLVGDLDAIALTAYDPVRSLLQELPAIGYAEMLEHDTERCQIALLMWTAIEVGASTQSAYAYLDDAGDARPADPAFPSADPIAEVIEVGPLDLELSTPEVHVAEAITDEVKVGPIYGEFDARLFKTNENSGDVVELSVKVKNLSLNAAVKSGTVVSVFKAEDGTYFAVPGSMASAAYFGTVTALLGADDPNIQCDIYSVAGDDYSFVENASVLHLGSSLPQVGDEVVVFKSSDGTYWTKAGDETPPFGLARVSSDAANKDAVPCRLYQSADLTTPDAAISVKLPALQSTAKVSAGTWLVVMRFGGSWVGYLPLIRPRVLA